MRCRKSAKFERCVRHVKARGGKSARFAWPICTVSVCKVPSSRKR